jgi:hypothetical protein
MAKLSKKLRKQLSKKIEFLHCNDFSELLDKEKHHLFTIGKFMVWVVSFDNVVSHVVGTDESDMEQFEGKRYRNVTKEQWEAHYEDVKILNTPEAITEFQTLIQYLN